MFVGEALCLVIWKVYNYYLKFQKSHVTGINQDNSMYYFPNADYAGIDENGSLVEHPKPRPPLFYFAAFCSIDMVATILSGYGLIWVDASLYQMLRGAQVIFAAFASMALMGKKYSKRQWTSLGVVVLGLALVGVSGLLKAAHDIPKPDSSSNITSSSDEIVTPGQQLAGTVMILASAALWGLQSVLEEKYMKKSEKYECEPLELVGWEGTFGSLLTGLVVLPAAQYIPGSDCGNVVENSLDTFAVLKASLPLLILVICYSLNLTVFNFLSVTVSKVMSAVHRQLINAARTISVWGVGLYLHYYVRESLGESWNNYSFLELGGFSILMMGTYVYATSPQLPVASHI